MMMYNIFSSGGFGSYGALGVEHIVKDLINAVSLAIVIIVCAVPEGLPLMISLVLMQNTKKMLDKNVLVRKAIGIETAGSLNILFSDKTGTITKGKLEVVEYFTGDGKVISDYQDEFKYAVGKNTQSSFDSDGNIIGGNFTDRALVAYLGQANFDKVVNDGNKIENSQGFNSTNKFSQAQVGGKTYYKGAPERLVVKAKKYLDEFGEVKDLDENVLNEKIDSLAERAMRVLAFGYSEKPMVENEINDDIVLIGLVGIRDEVRDYGVFGKAQRYLVNKFKVFLYNHFSTNESASAQEEQKTIKRLKIKKLAQENKIKLTNDVNEIIKNKLGSRVYNEQEDLFRLKATKIRLSLLPEIFDSIKITRAQYRKQGIEPNVSNKNAARLYELINGSNRKIIRYMLKISDKEGNRIFNVNQIIEFIEKANKDICDAKSMKPDYKASDTKAYYNNLFDELNKKYGKLKRDSKTKK